MRRVWRILLRGWRRRVGTRRRGSINLRDPRRRRLWLRRRRLWLLRLWRFRYWRDAGRRRGCCYGGGRWWCWRTTGPSREGQKRIWWRPQRGNLWNVLTTQDVSAVNRFLFDLAPRCWGRLGYEMSLRIMLRHYVHGMWRILRRRRCGRWIKFCDMGRYHLGFPFLGERNG